MGQYYIILNLDKKQYLRPWNFGDGAKLLEFGTSGNGVMLGLAILLSDGNDRGGGDLRVPENAPEELNSLIGSWAGDRIVVSGDYADDGKFLSRQLLRDWRKNMPPDTKKWIEERAKRGGSNTPNLYTVATDLFENISEKVIQALCMDQWIRKEFVNMFAEMGWREAPKFLGTSIKERIKEIKQEKEQESCTPENNLLS